MFNTTTSPTPFDSSVSFLYVASILATGVIVGVTLIEQFLYRLREQGRQQAADSDTDSDSDGETDDSAAYGATYAAAFAALPVRELSETELTNLHTKFVREQVAAAVEVVLTFDKATETFWYYTDKLKEVSYDILETVAQKFALEYDCKAIFLLTEDPAQALEPAMLEPAQALEPATLEPATLKPAAATKPSVFAKFKDYNTGGKGSVPNFTSVVKVIEQMNHFRYRGKICDYEASLKAAEKKGEEEKTIDYASYKKFLESNKIKTL